MAVLVPTVHTFGAPNGEQTVNSITHLSLNTLNCLLSPTFYILKTKEQRFAF